MKKLICIALALLMLAVPALAVPALTTPALAQEAAPTAKPTVPLDEATPGDAALISAARELIASMCTLCSDEDYVAMYTAGNQISEVIAEAMALSYDSPLSIVVLSMPIDAVDALIGTLVSAPDDAQTQRLMRLKMYNILPTTLNGYSGVEWVAANSIMTQGDVRLLENVQPCVAYVIFDYGSERPAAVMSAHVDEGGLASLTASLCNIPEDLRPMLLGGQIDDAFSELHIELPSAISEVISHTAYSPFAS